MATPRKQILQETFDECVAENVADFDMSLEQATADAVQQFESQGVDLSNIIKNSVEGQEPLSGRLQQLLLELRECLNLKKTGKNVLDVVMDLQRVCNQVPEARVVAGRNDAVGTLLALLDTDSDAVVASCSTLLALLCTENGDNQDVMGSAGMQRLVSILQQKWETAETVVCALALVKAACVKHESNKAQFTKTGGGEVLCSYFDQAKGDEVMLTSLARCLRVLTTNDDPCAMFSQAQDTIRVLVERHVIPYSLDILRQGEGCETASGPTLSLDLLVNWLAVLAQVAVTKENCQQIADLDGLTAVQSVMRTYEDSAVVANRCIKLFRNVAAADELKRVILQCGSIEQTLLVMRRYESDASIQQNACATLGAVALRSPENSRVLVELGAIRHISRAIQVHNRDVAVLRQASLAVRNMVARNVELRSRFLHDEPKLEPLLREAQQYRGCGDEAYAALRDLGCDIQLSSFGVAAVAAGSISVPTTALRFNPVQLQSNELHDSVDEVSEASFSH
uniref:Armadillo repeat-containing domain-containing protein n=1 Tax=Hyaloperonospora arabidopsidis (strain Emoy2) TaxID=559515 RepID=M4B8N7_HYAAE